jgi:hypothetical protein
MLRRGAGASWTGGARCWCATPRWQPLRARSPPRHPLWPSRITASLIPQLRDATSSPAPVLTSPGHASRTTACTCSSRSTRPGDSSPTSNETRHPTHTAEAGGSERRSANAFRSGSIRRELAPRQFRSGGSHLFDTVWSSPPPSRSAPGPASALTAEPWRAGCISRCEQGTRGTFASYSPRRIGIFQPDHRPDKGAVGDGANDAGVATIREGWHLVRAYFLTLAHRRLLLLEA